MYIKANNVEYNVDVLYGFEVIVDRGIKFSRSEDGTYGHIDRNIDNITSVITIQSDYTTMTAIDSGIRNGESVDISMNSGEHIFGPQYWYRTSTSTKAYFNCVLKNVGKIARKNLKQYTLQISVVKPSGIELDPQYDSNYTPSWDTDIRYNAGYSTSLNHNIIANDILDGTTVASSNRPLDYTTKLSSIMTDEESALWNNSLILGNNRIYNNVKANDMNMDLFGYNTYSTLQFYVKSFTFSSTSFDKWNYSFELLLNKRLSV